MVPVSFLSCTHWEGKIRISRKEAELFCGIQQKKFKHNHYWCLNIWLQNFVFFTDQWWIQNALQWLHGKNGIQQDQKWGVNLLGTLKCRTTKGSGLENKGIRQPNPKPEAMWLMLGIQCCKLLTLHSFLYFCSKCVDKLWFSIVIEKHIKSCIFYIVFYDTLKAINQHWIFSFLRQLAHFSYRKPGCDW